MKIKIYSTTWCADCIRNKAYLDRNGIVYEEVDIEANPEFVEYVKSVNNGNQTVPTFVITYDDGTENVISEPSNEQLQNLLDKKTASE